MHISDREQLLGNVRLEDGCELELSQVKLDPVFRFLTVVSELGISFVGFYTAAPSARSLSPPRSLFDSADTTYKANARGVGFLLTNIPQVIEYESSQTIGLWKTAPIQYDKIKMDASPINPDRLVHRTRDSLKRITRAGTTAWLPGNELAKQIDALHAEYDAVVLDPSNRMLRRAREMQADQVQPRTVLYKRSQPMRRIGTYRLTTY